MKSTALIALLIGFIVTPLPAEQIAPKLPGFTAHRGESHDAPENTMAAVELAWKRGVEAVEIDVHLSADGKLIVIHDADTARVAGEKLVVKSQPAEALRKLDAGKWKGEAFAGQKLPLLDEVLPTIPAGKRLFIEVKIGPEAIPPLVEALKLAGKTPDQTTIISFNIETIRAARQTLPNIKAYWLASQKQDKQTGTWAPTVDQLITQAKSAGATGLSVSAAKAPVDAAFVKAVHDAGLECYVWTIDDPALARKLAAAGVDNITSNRAAWLREQLKK